MNQYVHRNAKIR